MLLLLLLLLLLRSHLVQTTHCSVVLALCFMLYASCSHALMLSCSHALMLSCCHALMLSCSDHSFFSSSLLCFVPLIYISETIHGILEVFTSQLCLCFVPRRWRIGLISCTPTSTAVRTTVRSLHVLICPKRIYWKLLAWNQDPTSRSTTST